MSLTGKKTDPSDPPGDADLLEPFPRLLDVPLRHLRRFFRKMCSTSILSRRFTT